MTATFATGVYMEISYDDLLLYAVWSLQNEGVKVDWHDVVARVFEFFPQRFGLTNYTDKYPDSAQVDKSILRCRDKGCLAGQRAKGYSLTGTGLLIVESVSKRLKVSKDDKKDITEAKANKKSRAGRIILHIKNSAAFKKYKLEKTRDTVNDYEVCAMLLCSLDTPSETRKKNIIKFRDEARIGNWDDMEQFLIWVQEKFPNLFQIASKPRKGMFG